MAKKVLSQSSWVGGQSTDQKKGPANSFWYSLHVDFRKNPSKISLLPMARLEGNVTQLIQQMIQTTDGVIWAIGDLGCIYRRTTAKEWHKFSDLASAIGAYGMAYRDDLDKVFIAEPTTVTEINKVTTAPSVILSKYADSASTDSAASSTTGSLPTTFVAAFDEQSKLPFTSDIEPIDGLYLNLVAVSTGTITVTIHDGENNQIATGTLAPASQVIGWNKVPFTTPARILVKPNGRPYHAHIYSSVANGSMMGTKKNDITSIDFKVSASRFVSTRNGMHPSCTFNQWVVFGNGRYVSVFEPLSDVPGNSEFERHKIVLPPGYEVCGVAQWQEYLAVAAEKITTQSNGTQFQDGKIFFWDGIGRTYNFYIDVPEGSPGSLSVHEQVLKYIAGGALYGYAGGRPVKLRTFRNTDSEFSDVSDYTRAYPYMMAVRQGVHLIGYPSNSTNVNLEYGAYSYGKIDEQYPDSFGLSHSISADQHFNTDGNLQLGCVRNFGDTTFISWKDGGGTHGIDVIDNMSDPYANGRLEQLRFDDGRPWKYKKALTMVITADALPAGATVEGFYRIDSNDDNDWVSIGSLVEGETILEKVIPQGEDEVNRQFLSIDLAVELNATTITPYVTSVNLEYDDDIEEQKVA